MPLLDELYGPQRVLPARQQEQFDLEQRAALSGTTVEQERQRAESPTKSAPEKSLLSDLIGPLSKTSTQSSIDALLGVSSPTTGVDLLASRTPAPITGSISAPTGTSPYIGRKNYQIGKGDPGLRTMAQAVSQSMGWDSNQFAAWDALINAESGWRPNAQNPTSTAFGLGQFLDSTWKGYGAKTTDPGQQLAYMAKYIKDRYGTPEKALAWHAAKNWY